jgi:hypothetical protein
MSDTRRVTATLVGVEAAPRDETRGGGRPSPERWHPSSLDWDSDRPAPGASQEAWDRAPTLVTAGMVLLAAAAIFEGYRRLNVISANELHPSALVFAAVAVPAAPLLARTALATAHRFIRVAVEATSLGLVAMTVLEMVVTRPWSARTLGACDLLMAAAVLGAAVVSGDFSST